MQLAAIFDEELDARRRELAVDDVVVTAVKAIFKSKRISNAEIKQRMLDLWPATTPLFDKWSSTQIRHMSLTSVGIAIQHANAARQFSSKFDLSIWIKAE